MRTSKHTQLLLLTLILLLGAAGRIVNIDLRSLWVDEGYAWYHANSPDLVLSLGTEFIDNRDAAQTPADAGDEQRKQDCELKASHRLVRGLRQDYPQLRLCFTGDSLFGCGEGFQIAREAGALVGTGRNSLRTPDGASGLRSNMSCVGGPPCR